MTSSNSDPLQTSRSSLAPKGLLYHYTTVDGFLGILESDSLRATHIRYMNDSKEFVGAIEHSGGLIDSLAVEFEKHHKESLDELAPELRGVLSTDAPTSIRESLLNFLRSISPHMSGRSGAYIVSFTDDSADAGPSDESSGDRLSQWRAYGGVRGISLGFDFRSLHGGEPGKVWILDDKAAYLLNCLYKPQEKKTALTGAADVVLPSFTDYVQEVQSAASESKLRVFRKLAILAWVINACTFKDPSFSEEHEWRIVILGSPPLNPIDNKEGSRLAIRFRSGSLGVTPYVSFPLRLSAASSPLRQVTIGPTPHAEEALKAVEMALLENGVELWSESKQAGVKVLTSRIPYRSW